MMGGQVVRVLCFGFIGVIVAMASFPALADPTPPEAKQPPFGTKDAFDESSCATLSKVYPGYWRTGADTPRVQSWNKAGVPQDLKEDCKSARFFNIEKGHRDFGSAPNPTSLQGAWLRMKAGKPQKGDDALAERFEALPVCLGQAPAINKYMGWKNNPAVKWEWAVWGGVAQSEPATPTCRRLATDDYSQLLNLRFIQCLLDGQLSGGKVIWVEPIKKSDWSSTGGAVDAGKKGIIDVGIPATQSEACTWLAATGRFPPSKGVSLINEGDYKVTNEGGKYCEILKHHKADLTGPCAPKTEDECANAPPTIEKTVVCLEKNVAGKPVSPLADQMSGRRPGISQPPPPKK